MDRTLIVPGTQATTLRDQDGATVYNAVRVSLGMDRKDLGGRPPSLWQDLLSVDHDQGQWAPRSTSLLAKTKIVPGQVVKTPYDRLPRPNDFFPYDWRLDCRYNAQRLIDHLRARKPRHGRWNLIGHSQGGLLIVLARTLTTGVEEFGQLVRRVVLVGCPLAGTQRAVEALAVGRGDFGETPFRIDAARGMAQSWPALYQMLPCWNSVLDENGRALGSSEQFTDIGGYPGALAEGIQEDHLLRARETHALLKGSIGSFVAAVETLVIQGEKQDTPTWITKRGGALRTTGKEVGGRRELDFAASEGDTLVPSEVTLASVGPSLRARTLRISGKVTEHAAMCDGTFVTKKISRFLAALVLFVGLTLPVGARAQQYRLQVGGMGAFSDGYLLTGLDFAEDIGGVECERGRPPCRVPEWTALMGAYAGLVTERFPLTAYGHLGLGRKLTGELRVGAVAFFFANPLRWGLAGRFDSLDVVALYAGYAWGPEPGLVVAVEVAVEFLRDISFR